MWYYWYSSNYNLILFSLESELKRSTPESNLFLELVLLYYINHDGPKIGYAMAGLPLSYGESYVLKKTKGNSLNLIKSFNPV